MSDAIARRCRMCAQGLLILTSLSALIICPHSKVEESFQLQATHDVYYHGLHSIANYDHLQYPGVVPRTFTGPLILATLCRVVTIFLYPILDLAAHPLAVQMVARGILLTLVCHAWFRMAAAAAASSSFAGKANSSWRGTYLLLLTAVQFHMPFYASRMLPNTFALVLVLHAYSDWLLSAGAAAKSSCRSSSTMLIQRSAVWLVTATAIFRCDVLLLLFSVGLVWLIQQQITVFQALRLGIFTGMACLAVTVPLDSYMWQTFPIWPEGQVFYYNTVMGKSSDWGVSPWYWYLTSALPKAMILTTMLLPFAVLRIPQKLVLLFQQKPLSTTSNNDKDLSTLDTTMLPYLLATTGFIGLYSCLGHKEMRFMFPAMPMLNLMAAVGLERLHQAAFASSTVTTFKDKIFSSPSSWLARLVYIGALLGCCGVTLLASLAFVGVSRHNYPGGTALQLLVKHVAQQQESSQDQEILVHVDVAAAMTGISLFGQRAAGPNYSFVKAGYEEEHANTAGDFSRFTHLLSETKDIDGFHVVAISPGHPRLDWRKGIVTTHDGIFVLTRITSD